MNGSQNILMRRRSVGPWSLLLLVLVIAAAVGFGVWVHKQTVTAVARGEGIVQPLGKSARVFSVVGGTVAPHTLKVGMAVVEGQVLFRVETVTEVAVPQASTTAPNALRAVVARLTAEVEGAARISFPSGLADSAEAARENAVFADRRTGQARALRALRDENEKNRLEIAAQKAAAERAARGRDLAQKELDLLGPLVDRGISPKLESLRVQQKVQELEAQREQALLAVPRLEAAIQDIAQQIEAVESDFQRNARRMLAAKQRELAALPPRPVAKKRETNETEVRAPIAGALRSVRISNAGGTIDPGRELAVIAPHAESLLIKGRIPAYAGESVLPKEVVTVTYGLDSVGLVAKYLTARPTAGTPARIGAIWEIDLRVDRSAAGFEALAESGGPVSFAVKYQKPLFAYLFDRVWFASGGQVRQRVSGQ